jgi:hypothetical protein
MTHSSQHTTKQKRKQQSHPPRDPSYFFIGRQPHPPYAWAYDDDEMRASNIMWITEEVIDDKDLEKVYFREIASEFKWRRARMPMRETEQGRKRRKGLSGGIIDLSISDSGEDGGDTGLVGNGRRQSISSHPNPERSVQSPSTSSINSSTFTRQPQSSQPTPTKRRLAVSAVNKKRVPELRAVFVSLIRGSLSLANG